MTAPTVQAEGPWPGGARAAYSIIHDDVGDPSADGVFEHGLRELEARGLLCGLAVVVEPAQKRGLLGTLRDAVARGHEAINHSWSHQNLTECRDYATEVDQARSVLEAGIGQRVPFFAFPFDEFDETAVAHLRAAGYRGARAGARGLNPLLPVDDFAVSFDTYGPDYSLYEGDVLTAYLDDAMQKGGWAVRELHGVADQSWESVPLDRYRAHLDDVAARVQRGELWVAPPSAVLKWRRQRARVSRPFPRLVRPRMPC